MAQPAPSTTGRQPKRRTARAATRRRRVRNGHARPARRTTNSTLGQLEQVIRNLEQRVADLTNGHGIRSTVSHASGQVGSVVAGATNQVGEAVADTLSDMAAKLRTGAHSVTSVARLGTGALQRIGDEVEKRPFMTVAIALGIGFLAGLAGRQNEQGGRRN